MNPISARTGCAASAVAGQGVRPSSSDYSSATAASTRRSCRTAKRLLYKIIRGRVPADTVIHSDGWRGYDGLVDVGYAKHYRVHHGANEFVNDQSHINGIESFWSYAKRRLQKFNGVPVATFHLHLKECEWRFNHRHDDLYLELLRLLRQYPL